MRSCWFPASLPGIVLMLAFALSCLHPSGTPGRLKQTDSANTAALLSRVWSRDPVHKHLLCSIVPGGNGAPVQMLPPQPLLLLLLGNRSEASVRMTSAPLPHRPSPGFCQMFVNTSSQLTLKSSSAPAHVVLMGQKHQVRHHQVLIPPS